MCLFPKGPELAGAQRTLGEGGNRSRGLVLSLQTGSAAAFLLGGKRGAEPMCGVSSPSCERCKLALIVGLAFLCIIFNPETTSGYGLYSSFL